MSRPLAAALLLLAAPFATAAERPLMHPLFSDHAVLQRGEPIRVWGGSTPGSSVTVTFRSTMATGSIAAKSAVAPVDPQGRWLATLPPADGSGPFELSARAADGTTQVAHDVLSGEVWLCSGQSNMVLQVHRTLDSRAEIAGSDNLMIRMLTVPLTNSLAPLETFAEPVAWQVSGPATTPDFSATCYYFARELRKVVGAPMGLINSSWGGTNIQTWMSREKLKSIGGHDEALDVLDLYARDPLAANQRWGAWWESWWRSRTSVKRGKEPWSAAGIDAPAWRVAPRSLGVWEEWGIPELKDFNGMIWFRTTVKLTAKQAAQPASLALGPIDEADETWLNGRAIGYTSGASEPRVYAVPPGLLHAGENVVVVNVVDTYGVGGLHGPPYARALRFADATTAPLNGEWQFQVAPSNLGPPPRAPWEPMRGNTTVYNAMIAPLVPFPLKGVVWYQGESNAEDAGHYQALLAGLMADWRGKFGAELPFLIVQLANYGPATTAPAESGTASLREAQRLAVAGDPHAGLAVAIDIGERNDIHPANKQEVARRLKRAALHVIYGYEIAPSGPVADTARREGARVTVTFKEVTDRLILYGAARAIGFELCADAPGSCHYADATVAGANSMTLETPSDLATPTRVRFCWADSPICNLYDRSGLPAGPFELKVR